MAQCSPTKRLIYSFFRYSDNLGFANFLPMNFSFSSGYTIVLIVGLGFFKVTLPREWIYLAYLEIELEFSHSSTTYFNINPTSFIVPVIIFPFTHWIKYTTKFNRCSWWLVFSVFTQNHNSCIWKSMPNRSPLWLDFFYFEDELFLKALLGL